ncbi:amidase family protein [Paenibacillus sp. FSL L8-0463]|uniref:amidase family protein n=1 Tax=Paenibacillus sp. FSL L8-0463 TaxID=2954687 RepID=UPI00311A1204
MVLNNRFGAFIDPELEVPGLARGKLNGLSFAVKDVFAVSGHRSSAGNPHWLRSHAPSSAHAAAVWTLLQSGASLRGAAHTDELMYSLGGENYHYGTPVNPRAEGRIPGGSSSGSAVAVASGSVDFALGTDTGGSIRVPSAYCGVYGFRPTHGAVEIGGVIPLAPGFDTVGWIADSAGILLRVGEVLLGRVEGGAGETQNSSEKSNSLQQSVERDGARVGQYPECGRVIYGGDGPERNGESAGGHVQGYTGGHVQGHARGREPGHPGEPVMQHPLLKAAAVPASYACDVPEGSRMAKLYIGMDGWALAGTDSSASLKQGLDLLQAGVGQVLEAKVSPEGLTSWMDVFRELQAAEIWATHGAWIEREQPVFGPDIAARFAWAASVAGQDHSWAQSQRDDITSRLRHLLGEDGCLVIPTVPGPAPLRGGDLRQLELNRSGAMMLNCIAGLAGLPQVTLPVAGPGGLPLGLSVIGGRGQDLRLLSWVRRLWQ